MRLLVLCAAAALLAGCGDRNLVLKVDVLSFMAAADRQKDFGPIPAAPGGIATGEVAIIDNQEINMLAGLGDASRVQSVNMAFGALAIDTDGSGQDTLRVYLSDPQTNPRTTPPVLTQAIDLTPGVTDTLQALLNADARVLALFEAKAMRVSVTTSLRGPSLGNPLSGTIRITTLDGTVVAGWKGF